MSDTEHTNKRFNNLHLKFKSSNPIPADRAIMIDREEYEHIVDLIEENQALRSLSISDQEGRAALMAEIRFLKKSTNKVLSRVNKEQALEIKILNNAIADIVKKPR